MGASTLENASGGPTPAILTATAKTLQRHKIMKASLRELAEAIGARLIGDDDEVTGVSSVESAVAGKLVFAQDQKLLASCMQSPATAVIAGEFAANVASPKPVLISGQPRLTFARAAAWFGAQQVSPATIDSTAVVAKFAKLGQGVGIGPLAVIEEKVCVGDRTRIGAGCVVGVGVEIGEDCTLFPNVTVHSGTRLGRRVIVHSGAVLGGDGFGYVRDQVSGRYEKIPQMGRLEIEDDVEIGANATIDRGALDLTRIRRGTKIDNLVHVGHNVDIGEDVVIAAQTGISGSCVIGSGAIIGGQVGIGDHVRIEEGVILGAACGVPSNKTVRGKGIVFWGTPARPLKQYLKTLATLARLAKK